LKPTADALNHLLRQNSWASEQLRPYAGKTVRISIPPFSSALRIEPWGEFSSVADLASIDAEITLSPGAALRTLFDPETAASSANLDGDPELGAAVGKILRKLRWDAEADLSRIVGDIPAHELAKAGTHIRQELGRQALALASMFSEYWLEEQPQIAKQRHLEQFAREVDVLRNDVERFAKRLERLEQKA
jgi:ubiquinone biosynthesis protein UbiJ